MCAKFVLMQKTDGQPLVLVGPMLQNNHTIFAILGFIHRVHCLFGDASEISLGLIA